MAGLASSIVNTASSAIGKWSGLNTSLDNAREKGIQIVMDSIIDNNLSRSLFSTVMLGASANEAIRAARFGGGLVHGGASGFVSNAAAAAFNILSLTDVSVLVGATLKGVFSKVGNEIPDIWDKALMMPNIEGVPINTDHISSTREVDVGEQMLIVQSTTTKNYWSDNAVPHLKTWQLDGYITAQLAIDSLYITKPSLRMQIEFLDICARSRRPVLFKDNKGEFSFVQITNLTEESSPEYNNAIKVSISLREYKPYEVDTLMTKVKQASIK